VSSHNLKSLRSLITDVVMFFDLVNVVEKTFESPFLQLKLSVSLLLFLNLISTW